MTRPESARVTTYVDVSPADAFQVFTEEVDLWWRREPRFRGGGADSQIHFEQDQRGRRLVETSGGDSFELGRVLTWEPGKRLVLTYRLRNFAPEEFTELEVRFEPQHQGTRVILEHRGWERLGKHHPARKGLSGEALSSMLGLQWGDLATSYRVRCRVLRRT
ncbi:MAG: SRPBCC domain-containing protein [Myxococcales bacterium]